MSENNTNQFSVKTLAEKLSVDPTEAYGFIKVMMAHGAIEKTGIQKQEGKRGKPTNLYTFKSEQAQTLIFEKMMF